MLSRRNVRIKVMQVIYSMNRGGSLNTSDALNIYRESVSKSYELFVYSIKILVGVTGYALKDYEKRSSKHLPTAKDKVFTAKLYQNPSIQSLVKNPALNDAYRNFNMLDIPNDDIIRSLYASFAKTDEYQNYLANPDTSAEAARDIILTLYKHLIKNESCSDELEEKFPNWIDDKSLVVGAMKKTLKRLPLKDLDYIESYKPTYETITEFGEVLLRKTCDDQKDLMNLIEPTLKNWDADRVAVIDMILLKMALCELLHFPTIPTKVTLNEFVEISKLYSTPKSKDFINGILDRLMKKLNKDGKIKKEGRGLVD